MIPLLLLFTTLTGEIASSVSFFFVPFHVCFPRHKNTVNFLLGMGATASLIAEGEVEVLFLSCIYLNKLFANDIALGARFYRYERVCCCCCYLLLRSIVIVRCFMVPFHCCCC